MKLKNITNSEDMYINEECYYIRRFHKSVLNNKGKKIGEVFGHIIDTEKVTNNLIENRGSDFFIELDCVSQLLCECADYIISQISLNRLKDMHNIIFLNRLSLDFEYSDDKNELEVFDLLFENAETIIYSFGRTELDDNFAEQENYNSYNHKKLLKETGWQYSKEYDFYLKSREDMWTKDKIMNRLCKPFKTFKLKEEEHPFWLWLFSDIVDNEKDLIVNYELNEDAIMNLKIFQYDYAKSYINSFNELDRKNTLVIEISPILFTLFSDYTDMLKELREDNEIGFTDLEIDKVIDSTISKYHKLFYKIKKENDFDGIYIPMLSRYFKNLDEFTKKKIRTIYTELVNSTKTN